MFFCNTPIIMKPNIFILMGVSASGKTTIGSALDTSLPLPQLLSSTLKKLNLPL
jgi:adenylylsulfate kinase-like enzyme